MNAAPENEKTERRAAYRRLLPFLGKIVPAGFLRSPSESIRGVERIHPLIEGIYKPASSPYAFSIASMLKSPYADKSFHNTDGSCGCGMRRKTEPSI